ncbi:MAG TPA: riboflavin synthase [Candidatus Cloacimonadota bacterium]|nr:riboflavin synthase [Candidatus Cloacimonadota bacterium]
MFTGIIEAISPILSLNDRGGKRYLKFQRPESFDNIKEGNSIACDGICLTVISLDKSSFEVELMAETLKKSTAASWKIGSKINLERALRVVDRLDGHWVQGHVDSVLTLKQIKTVDQTPYYYFTYPREDAELLVPQGSICLNGVSLTLAELNPSSFAVALIGHTLQNSNLSLLAVGAKVNVEYDILGKYILRKQQITPISKEWLHEQGF